MPGDRLVEYRTSPRLNELITSRVNSPSRVFAGSTSANGESSDRAFKISSLDNFLSDLEEIWGITWPRDIENRNTPSTLAFFSNARVDIDLVKNLVEVPGVYGREGVEITPPVLTGPHVNLRVTGRGANSLLISLDAFYFASENTTRRTPIK